VSISLRSLPDTIQTLKIDDATGALAAVAAPGPDSRVIVWGVILTVATTTTMKWKSGTTDLTGPMTVTGILSQISSASVWEARNPSRNRAYPLFECELNEAFNIELGDAVQMSGMLYYSIETE
jgi:hypothetical protein